MKQILPSQKRKTIMTRTRFMVSALLMVSLAGCLDGESDVTGSVGGSASSSSVSGGGIGAGQVANLVTLAAQGSRADLQAALNATNPAQIAGLRYGPFDNGLAHAAISNTANPEAVTQVARAGADVNLVDLNGRTPLHFALEMQSEASLLALLANGANPDIQTDLGSSPRGFCTDALRQVPDYQICLTLMANIR